MPAIEKVVKFLNDNKALKKGVSPWPAYVDSDAQQRYRINWNTLFPQHRNRDDVNDLERWPGDDRGIGRLSSDIEGNRGSNNMTEQDLQAMALSQSWDACAWYQPIHYFGYDWGIFIREDCVINQIFNIARFLPLTAAPASSLVPSLIRASVYTYFLHEQYHHKVECLGLRLHVVDRKSCYLPYDVMVYGPSKGNDQLLEEALANADAYQRIWNEPYRYWIGDQVLSATQAYLKATFPHNPPGYRLATNYLDPHHFEIGENLLHGQMHEATLTPSQPTNEWEIATRLMQSMFRVTDNIWTIVPSGRRSILPIISSALYP
jgi:hypothetical protein